MARLAAMIGQAQIAVKSDALPVLGGVSIIGFLATALLPSPYHLSTICGQVSLAEVPRLYADGLFFPSAIQLVVGWLIMTAAMMPLLVLDQVAYGFCWLVAGLILAPAAMLLSVAVEPRIGVGLVLVAALLWSASPVAQLARNRCHRTLRIGAFGHPADRDCVRQGVLTGTACVSTCWIWMLLPAMAGNAHLAFMAIVTVVLLADRLAQAGPPCWHLPALEVILGPRPWRRVGS